MKDDRIEVLAKNVELKTISFYLRKQPSETRNHFYQNVSQKQRDMLDSYSMKLVPTDKDIQDATNTINQLMNIIINGLH